MTLGERLINKTFYQTIVKENSDTHPIKILGEMAMNERQNDMPDLSYIRFAQGEVYFLHKDFEAAIFKWENISNELKPWALKNIGDAHYELDLLAIAEDFYKDVDTDSELLKMEVLLQLFSLYIRLGNIESACDTIKKAVQLNPDYSDVTTLARTFFEDNGDYDSAVELAMNEAIRTVSRSWFAVLEEYVEEGHTVKLQPTAFSDALLTLYPVDDAHFESLSTALWHSYKESDFYFSWLEVVNVILLATEPGGIHSWRALSSLFKETYFELINGKYLIKDISLLMPNHLTNWIKISTTQDALLAASAVLSWSEMFPEDIDLQVVSRAENLLDKYPQYRGNLEDVFSLFESIESWANIESLSLDVHCERMIRELYDLSHYRLLIVGSAMDGKSTFVNKLRDDGLLDDSAFPLFTEEDELDFPQSSRNRQTLTSCKIPVSSDGADRFTLTDAPIVVDQRTFRLSGYPSLTSVDSVLFILNADQYLTGRDLDMAVKIKEETPNLPIHFVLWKSEGKVSGGVELEYIQKTVALINSYFPNARVTSLTENSDSSGLVDEWSRFTRSKMEGHQFEEERSTKILYYIKMLIRSLLEKRVEAQNSILDKIEWNKEIEGKLQGAYNQLSDMEEQKVQVIKNSYDRFKAEWQQGLMLKIPELLRECSDMINEECDFGKIHVQINDEMNRRVQSYIEETALPRFREKAFEWALDCEKELMDSKAYLDEMSAGFNDLYGEEKVALNCDFRVLEDWRRDIDRMTRGDVQLEKINIFLRSTPSQFLLKGAGKLLGSMARNKEMLSHKYKQFIEGKDYSGVAGAITDELMQPYEFFERSLKRDINMFFAIPFEVLNKSREEIQLEIAENKNLLNTMRENPEIYRDPLTLFELKLHQFELMERKHGDGSFASL